MNCSGVPAMLSGCRRLVWPCVHICQGVPGSRWASSSRADNTTREARFMKKLMTSGNRKLKKVWYRTGEVDLLHKEQALTGAESTGHHQGGSNLANPRRVAVLNSVFFKQITSLLATGEVGILGELHGKGLEITKVKVAPDINAVNIFWYTSKTDTPESELESLLMEASFALRHELSQLRVIGVVPPIRFIRDKSQGKGAQVEALLAKADMGPEETTLEEVNISTVADDPQLPKLRTDILGLQRAVILERVVKAMNKGRAVHRDCPSLPDQPTTIQEPSQEGGRRAADFAQYLRKAKAARLRDDRISGQLAESQLNQEEAEERRRHKITLLDKEDGDYLDMEDNSEDYVDEEDFYR